MDLRMDLCMETRTNCGHTYGVWARLNHFIAALPTELPFRIFSVFFFHNSRGLRGRGAGWGVYSTITPVRVQGVYICTTQGPPRMQHGAQGLLSSHPHLVRLPPHQGRVVARGQALRELRRKHRVRRLRLGLRWSHDWPLRSRPWGGQIWCTLPMEGRA